MRAADVVLASRSADRCADAAACLSARTGRSVRGHACDVTSERAAAGLIDRVLADCGRLDVLVTSAGIQARGTLDQLGVQALRACLEVNVVGAWLACRAAAAPMRAAGYGRILTMASALGLAGAAARAGYAASKGAVVQLTRSLAVELATLPDGPVRMQLSFTVGPRRNWLNLWKPTIDALGQILGNSSSGQSWHPQDGRIVEVGLHGRVEQALGNEVLITIEADSQQM